MEHAIIQPSGMDRTVRCVGNVQAQQFYPDESNQDSLDGEASHWVGSEILQSYKDPDTPVKLPDFDFLDKPAPNGTIITEEMIDGAEIYVDDVLQVVQADGLTQAMCVEERIDNDIIHPLNWGTPDMMIFNQAALRLYGWDYKFGRGIHEPKEHWQVMNYMVMKLEQLRVQGIDTDFITVEIRIVQPRAYHPDGVIRTWVIDAPALESYAETMRAAAIASQQIDPPTRAGPWCNHCRARPGCKSFRETNYVISDITQSLHLYDLNPGELATELKGLEPMLDLLQQCVDGLRAQGLAYVNRGVMVPGFARGTGRGKLDWNKPIDQVIAMGEIMQVDLKKPVDIITPTQAIAKKVDEAVILEYAERYSGTARLIHDDGTVAARVFGNT